MSQEVLVLELVILVSQRYIIDIRASCDIVLLLIKNIYKARISIFFTTTKYPSVLLLVTRDRTYYGLVTPSYIANLL